MKLRPDSIVNNTRRRVMRLLTGGITRNTAPVGALPPDSVKRILLCRPNSRLGNMLMVTPLLQELGKLFPDAKVDMFVRSRIAPTIFGGMGNVGEIIMLPGKPFGQLLKYIGVWFSILRRRYDIVINAAPNSSSGRLSANLARARHKILCDTSDAQTVNIDRRHMAKRPVYNLRDYLGMGSRDTPAPPLSIGLTRREIADGKRVLDNILHRSTKKRIGIYTFATGGKCYPPQWWRGVYQKLLTEFGDKYDIIEILPIENISQIDFAAPALYSRDIREIAAAIDNLSAFVTADCGIMHLASATSTPVVGMFSITDIETYRPYNHGSTALKVTSATTPEDISSLLRNILTEERSPARTDKTRTPKVNKLQASWKRIAVSGNEIDV